MKKKELSAETKTNTIEGGKKTAKILKKLLGKKPTWTRESSKRGRPEKVSGKKLWVVLRAAGEGEGKFCKKKEKQRLKTT